WQAERLTLDAKTVNRAGFSGYIMRRYENPRGDVVNVMLACGRPGPLSVHTPEVCYGASGFVFSNNIQKWAPGAGEQGTADSFWKTVLARKKQASPEKLQVFWSWNNNGAWVAADKPRWTFAGTPVLYKLYVTQTFIPRQEVSEGEACQQFLREFIPETQRVLAQ